LLLFKTDANGFDSIRTNDVDGRYALLRSDDSLTLL
jgi:THO complex subunit 4